VPKQLDASHLVNSPCDALTASQLTGLDQIYSEHPSMAYWRPMVIDGYPAVAASQYDARAGGDRS
jgi:hypothetical protein